MAGQWWTDDDGLLDVLKDALNIQREMPRHFVEAGRSAYVWRTIDAELAALTYDSSWDADELSAIRAETAALRALTFASSTLTIELEITPEAVFGQISPEQAGRVSVRVEAREIRSVPIDELGFFLIRPIPTDPFRLLCSTEGGDIVLTGWVSP